LGFQGLSVGWAAADDSGAGGGGAGAERLLFELQTTSAIKPPKITNMKSITTAATRSPQPPVSAAKSVGAVSM
jgi:hypothetical protein